MYTGVLKYPDILNIMFLGCVPYAQSWVFFQILQNTVFLLLYYSVGKKATAMVFICGGRGYPAIRFEFKTTSERYLVYFNCLNLNIRIKT